ncbi:hypothetical protein ACFRMQ_40265, partial [Kitasatospora sp. NPDC056783]
VYPNGKPVPSASNLNFSPRQTVPNLVTVPVGSNGKIAFFNHVGTTDVIADLAGYYVSGAPRTGGVLQKPDAPTRLLDTRDGTGTGGATAPVGEGRSIGLQVTGTAGIPANNVTAVVLNVTVTNPTSDSFLTVYPNGKPVPSASNLNFSPRQTVPNLVTVPVGTDGKIAFFNHVGTTDVIADLAGYYSAGDQLGLSALSFSAQSVDASASATPVTVTWTITDSSPAATQTSGSIVIRQRGDAPDTYVGQSYSASYSQYNQGFGGADYVSGGPAGATYRYTFVVPRYAGSATAKWAVSLVTAYENSTQQRLVLSGSALGGFANTVTATHQVSTTTALQPSVDLNLNGRPPYVYVGDSTYLSYSVGIQEQQSGFWKGTLTLTGPGGATLNGSFENSTHNGQLSYPCQSSVNYPTCTVLVLLPARAAAGTWSISSVSLTNNAGQTKSFTPQDPRPVTVTTNGTVSADRFGTTPNELNSWRQPAPFKVLMRVQGAQNGVRSIELRWQNYTCGQNSTTPSVEPDGRFSVPATLSQSRNGSPASCSLAGVLVTDGAGNIALYGSDYFAPDPGVSVSSVPDTTPPTVTSASLNITSLPKSQAGSRSLYVIAKVVSPTAPVSGYYSYVYDGSGNVVGQSSGSANASSDGQVTLNLYVPYGMAVGSYTVGFEISDAGWLRTSYGMPGSQPVPGGPLVLTVTEG